MKIHKMFDVLRVLEEKCDCTKRFIPPERSYEDYDQAQLKAGTTVELEHTEDKEIAKNIAANHLDEDEDYYRKLKKMESDEGDELLLKESWEQEQRLIRAKL